MSDNMDKLAIGIVSLIIGGVILWILKEISPQLEKITEELSTFGKENPVYVILWILLAFVIYRIIKEKL